MTCLTPDLTTRYLRLARDFENLAETYREMRIHGPAKDAEARKGATLMLVEHVIRTRDAQQSDAA